MSANIAPTPYTFLLFVLLFDSRRFRHFCAYQLSDGVKGNFTDKKLELESNGRLRISCYNLQ